MSGLETASELIALFGDASRDVADRLRDRLTATAKGLRRFIEGLELRAHTAHRFQQRRLELVDMEGRRKLIREAANHGDILDAVCRALVVLELEQADVAIAEAHRECDNAHDLAWPRFEPLVLARISDDHCLAGLQRQASEARAQDWLRLRRREKTK